MNLNNLLETINKQKRKNERAHGAKKFALAIVAVGVASLAAGVVYAKQIKKQSQKLADKAKNGVDEIQDGIETQVDAMNDSAKEATEKLDDGVDDVQKKSKNIKDDVKKGFHKVKETISSTAEHVANEIKK